MDVWVNPALCCRSPRMQRSQSQASVRQRRWLLNRTPPCGVGVQLIAIPEKEKLAAVAGTDGKTLVVSGVKRKNRASETLDAKQLAGHMGKRAQRGKLADVGFRADRLGE